jgi:hypothetical protein
MGRPGLPPMFVAPQRAIITVMRPTSSSHSCMGDSSDRLCA